MRRPTIGTLLVALALEAAGSPAPADPGDWNIVELVSPGETLGWKVSLDADTVAVANSEDDAIASGAGAVWVFQRDRGGPGAWGLVEKITAPGAASGDAFGSEVALRGDTLVASAYHDDGDGIGDAREGSPAGSLRGVGDLAGGPISSEANDVSADGRVVVGASESSGGTRAFRWEDGTLQGLGEPSGSTVARAISADGVTIVGDDGWGLPGGPLFRWREGVYTWYWAACPYGSPYTWGVSDDGSTVGINQARLVIPSPPQCTGQLPCLWYPEGGTTLELSSSDGAVRDTNADGSIAVGRQGDIGAVLWDLTGGSVVTVDLPDDDGTAYAITANAAVVVGESGGQAVRWDGTSMTPLGTLGGSGVERARDVSAQGTVIVGRGYVGSEPRAFIRTPQRGMRDLATELELLHGVTVGDWILTEAMGVSADGLTIVGHGIDPEGNSEGWIAVLSAPRVPSLGPWGLGVLAAALVLGAAAISADRRFRGVSSRGSR